MRRRPSRTSRRSPEADAEIRSSSPTSVICFAPRAIALAQRDSQRGLAEASEGDGELRAARQLEAGFELWKLGDRSGCVCFLEAATAARADAGEPVAAWAARGIEVDTVEGRRRARRRAAMASAATSLERFGLEATLRRSRRSRTRPCRRRCRAESRTPPGGRSRAPAWARWSADLDSTHRALEAIADALEVRV